MTNSDQKEPAWGEAKRQWSRIIDRLVADMPSLNATLLPVIPPSSGLPRFGESPYANFFRYLLALYDVCQQALYALERPPLFTSREWSSPWELYVKCYLCDFLSRVNTATDLLALMLNVLFELHVPLKQCSLEKGDVAGGLTSFPAQDSDISAVARNVGATLDRARSDWIGPFYELRNLVIHRNGLELGGGRHPDTGENYVFVLAKGLVHVAHDRKIVDQIVKRLDLLEDPLTMSSAIDPLNLCEQLWMRLATLVNSALDQSKPQIDRFISQQRAARR